MRSKIHSAEVLNTCSICLEVFGDLKNVHKLKCGHKFHKECIFRYFENGHIYENYTKYMNIPIEGSCPLCRKQQSDIIFGSDPKCCIIQ